MTDREKQIVRLIDHPIYTVEFLEEWTNRCDNVFINAPAALQTMGAKGFYAAIKRLAEWTAGNEEKEQAEQRE